ncbi:transcription factor bHLH157 [Cornus florida]|uniref:transcription factor bHLH157 n=1 Tax=Cornus florida TaxID=4283 RepID=UPI002898335D|nr:transcription factor bHLH157 [Cornus florida]
MCSQQGDPMIKNKLKRLCCNYGWSYGVFWRFNQRNSLLLTMEDAYYEKQMGAAIDDMLLQVHMLGDGIIGQAAFTKKNRWMFSDAHCGGQNPVGSNGIQDVFQDDSEIRRQFCSGIQTIAVISVEPRGVVQFGSTQKMLESMEFVDQTKRLFREMESCDGLTLSENAPSSSTSEVYSPYGLFTSSVSSGNSNFGNMKPMHGINSNFFMGTPCSSTNLSQPALFSSNHIKMSPLIRNSSHLGNQLQTVHTDAQVRLPNKSGTQLGQPFFQSTACVNHSAVQTPCMSSGDSILTSFEQKLPSEMGVQGSHDMFPAKPNGTASCRNTFQISPDSTFTSLHSTGGLLDVEKTSQYSSGELMNHQCSAMLFHGTKSGLAEISTSPYAYQDLFPASDFMSDLSNSCPLDDFSQLFVPSIEQSNNTMASALNDNLSQEARLASVLSNLNGADGLSEIPSNHLASSVQSSITSTFTSDGQEKCSNISGIENDLFDSLGVDFGCGQAGDLLDDILMPVMSGGQLDFTASTSGCISEQHVDHKVPQKGLFSKLGIEQLLVGVPGNSNSVARSSFEDELSFTAKRRRIGSSDQVQFSGLSCFGENKNLLQPVCNMDRKNNFEPKKEVILKSEIESWIRDSYSMNGRSTVVSQPKREEPAKVTKKKAKPGARPRPRDRQQIQDRINELKELIPNGVKMSIDSLLAQTIKHMLFLQSVTKHADELKQADEPKMIGQENKVVMKVNSSGGGGITWAYEFGTQTMVCPLVVEDLSPAGKMLIEMLCEEQGFFLEIVDIIRGFGLTILKGVMQVRENKLWARFIVEPEASRHVARVEIFMALVQLLQPTAASEIEASDQPSNVIDGGTTLFNNYHQTVVPLPISLADTLC